MISVVYEQKSGFGFLLSQKKKFLVDSREKNSKVKIQAIDFNSNLLDLLSYLRIICMKCL